MPRKSTPKKCLPCIIHNGNRKPLKEVATRIADTRRAAEKAAEKETDDSRADEIIDAAWETFYEELDREKITTFFSPDDFTVKSFEDSTYEFFWYDEIQFVRECK